jgi:GxxExxY protein
MLKHEPTLELSHEVIGASIEVHKLLGPRLLESVYQSALCRELELRRIPFLRQQRLPVTYKGKVLDCDLRLDLLVDKTIIVEIKAVDQILAIHKAQVLTYLRLQGLHIGLLINFNVRVLRNGISRILNG